MSIRYIEGAGPNFASGETGELFYRVHDVEEIVKRVEKEETSEDQELVSSVLKWISDEVKDNQDILFPEAVSKACKNLKNLGNSRIPTKRSLFKEFRKNPPTNPLSRAWLAKNLVTKRVRSESGVLVVTVLTSPYPDVVNEDGESVMEEKVKSNRTAFSCKYDCFYCPNEPGQPRSYLRDEPAVLRANQNGFDPVLQFWDRCGTLLENGHHVDKIEILVLGGTWSSYPLEYREMFIRDIFFAANTFLKSDMKRKRLSLKEEQLLNEKAVDARIIGVTLETRPDCINDEEIQHFRRVGCTRVQLGIQHTDDAILKGVNRGCTTKDAMRAIHLLKSTGFKVDAHLMPNLPNSNPELDRLMLKRMSIDPELSVDQIKVYPCEIVPFTKIEKWFKEKKYVPYSVNELLEIIIEFKSNIPPWIRLNRVVRDIPTTYQCASGIEENSDLMLPTNWRNTLQDEMKKRGLTCKCIRCREYQSGQKGGGDPVLCVRKYEASNNGTEYFLSFENENAIFGFCRLRIPSIEDETAKRIFTELEKCALIRELHVYGELVPRTHKKTNERQAQHSGFGTRLLKEAEKIVASNHPYFTHLSVISGVGVREFYKGLGFQPNDHLGNFLIKKVSSPSTYWIVHLKLYSVILGILFLMIGLGIAQSNENVDFLKIFWYY